MKYALGIDVGGTSVKLGRVSEKGDVLASTAFDTAMVSGPESWMEAVARHLPRLALDPESLSDAVCGIGTGVPGFVDFSRGFIHALTNVPGWAGVELARLLRQRFGVPAFVDNDVNAMALGECAFGAGRSYRHAVFVTLGTGVGGALLLDGRLYRGAYSMAGEIGHISIDRHGRASPEGRGGLEQYVGRAPLVEQARRALAEGRPSLVRDRVAPAAADLSPRILAEAAAEGDALARDLFDDLADALATAFASITYLLQPEVFIVGGGIAEAGPVLFEPLRRHLAERLSPYFADRIEVRPAQLGAAAGVVGAATLALAPE